MMAGFQFITVQQYSFTASNDNKRQSARNVAAEARHFSENDFQVLAPCFTKAF